jgi:hypothetical protein
VEVLGKKLQGGLASAVDHTFPLIAGCQKFSTEKNCRQGNCNWDGSTCSPIMLDSTPGPDGNGKPLQICQGDCDKDADCGTGLMCFQRALYTSVPGCGGMGTEGWDYCATAPSQDLDSSPGVVRHRVQSGGKPLAECQGDCDTDSDCAEDLVCFQRSGFASVPGCNGSGNKGWDYCARNY